MTEYLYEEQLKNEKFERLINTKEYLTKEEVDFILSWDSSEHDHILYLNENEFLNLRLHKGNLEVF